MLSNGTAYDSGSGLGTGAIAATVVAVIAALILVSFLVITLKANGGVFDQGQ